MTELNELFNKYGSDKGSIHGDQHRYSFIYEKLFSGYQDLTINILELGLCKGGPELVEKRAGISRTPTAVPSVEVWLEYFPKSLVYGFDISDFSEYEKDRFKFVRGDSGNVDDLNRVSAIAESFDIIIDDASHASFHQQLAFVTLFKSLKPGGIYIIEDLAWQPQSHEVALPKCPKTLDLFSHFIKYGNFDIGHSVAFKEMLRTLLHKTRIRTDKSLENYSMQNFDKRYLSNNVWKTLIDEIDYVSLYSKNPKSKIAAIWKANT